MGKGLRSIGRKFSKPFKPKAPPPIVSSLPSNQAIDNPEDPMQKKIAEQRIAFNTKKVEEIAGKYKDNQKFIQSAKELQNIINSPLAGGTGVLRYIASLTGHDDTEVNAKNAGQFYIEWLSQNIKVPPEVQKTLMEGFASIDKNPEASIAILNRFITPLKIENERFKKQLELHNKDATANLYSLEVLEDEEDNNNATSPKDNNNFWQQFQATK